MTSPEKRRPRHSGATRTPQTRLITRISAVAVLALAAAAAFAHFDPSAGAADSHNVAAGSPRPSTPTPNPTPKPSPTPEPTPKYHLPAAPAVPPPPTLTGYVIAASQPNSSLTGSCNSGTSVQVTGANSTVTVSGHCSAAVIQADGVTVNGSQFDTVYIAANNVHVNYTRGTPVVSNYGTGNTIGH